MKIILTFATDVVYYQHFPQYVIKKERKTFKGEKHEKEIFGSFACTCAGAVVCGLSEDIDS